MNILFVCTGNTCRSPIAEKLLIKKAAERNLDINVSSVGIAAIEGQEASDHAKTIFKEYGLTEKHTTKLLNEQLVEWADLILTMTTYHKQIIIKRFPGTADKVYSLKEYTFLNSEEMDNPKQVIPSLDIDDPFGGGLELYRRVAAEIDKSIEQLLKLDKRKH